MCREEKDLSPHLLLIVTLASYCLRNASV